MSSYIKNLDNLNNMMKKLILTLLLFSSGYSEPQDLSGKVFTFPLETNTAHVRVKTSKETFTSMTVCFRFFTDLSRNQALFSMATPSSDNAFLVFKSAADGRIIQYVQNKEARFDGLHYLSNVWQPFCSTWAAESGLVQLWLNGKPSSRKFAEAAPIKGMPIVVLGQEQDSHGSGFAADQSFVGMISNVHMWDYILSHCEIQQFSSEMSFTPGNVINWRSLEYQMSGKVLVEDKHHSCSN